MNREEFFEWLNKYKDLKLNDQYHENCIYDLVQEAWDRYYE